MSVVKNLRNKKVAPVLLFPFLMNIVNMMAWSVLILYALDLNASLLEISLMSLIGNTMAITLRIPFGILSDRVGRKPMLIWPEVIGILADLVRASATQPWHLILASCFGGLGGDIFANLLSIVGDLSEPRELPSRISTLYFCSSLGMIAGPTLASSLLLFTKIRTLYYISFFARIGLIGYLLYFVKEPERARVKEVSYRGSITNLLKKRNMIAGMSMTLFFFVMNSVEATFVPIFARQKLSLSDSHVASLQTFRNLAVMSFRFFSNEIFNRTGYKKLILSMLALSSLVGFTYPYSTDYQTLSALNFAFGLCFGAISLSGAVLTSVVADEGNRGIAHAVYSLTHASGTFTPAIMTPIAETRGISTVFSVGAVMPVIGMLLVAGVMREPSKIK